MAAFPPLVIEQGIAKRQDYQFYEDGDPVDLTEYTGTWKIVQDGETIASGDCVLTSPGIITVNVSAAQTDLLMASRAYRGRAVATLEITLIGPTVLPQTHRWQAAVVLWRAA